MLRPSLIGATLAAFCLTAVAPHAARADEPAPPDAASILPQAQAAAERGLAFLLADAAKWREEKKCATCHHGTMTVWALAEAKSRGYAVAPETFTDVVTWTKERISKIDEPRDTRPGWNMVSTPALYLALMAQCVPAQDAVSADELTRIDGHLVRHQEADGSWAWSLAPPANRMPPLFESDEVATLLADLVLRPHVPADPNEPSAVRDSLNKAADWLAKTPPTDTTQAAAFRLLLKVQAGEAAEALKADIDQFLSRQNADGGWGQLRELPSDAYATGQALYVLNRLGVTNDREPILRGLAFLVATQKEDGSWPMTPRAQPGETRTGNAVPITYLGSAWATLALMRTAPK